MLNFPPPQTSSNYEDENEMFLFGIVTFVREYKVSAVMIYANKMIC